VSSAPRWIKLFIALQLLFASLSASGALLYSNSRYDFTCCATVSDFDRPFQIADGFAISAETDLLITGVYWTGGYSLASTSIVDDFTIRFFADDDGRPQADPLMSIALGNGAARTDWGANRYSYLASIDPLRLAAGTQYFISIVANTAGSESNWYWNAEDFPAGATRLERVSDGDQWSGNGLRNYVFSLFGDAAPPSAVSEPGTLALLMLGLASLAFSRRRKQ